MIGAYLPATQTQVGTGATGFYVYQLDFGNTAILHQGSGVIPSFNFTSLSSALPKGSYIVADLGNASTFSGSTSWIATANSGAIFETSRNSVVPGPVAGAGIPGLLLAAGFMGLWYRRVRPKLS